jgi:hypothetical protein
VPLAVDIVAGRRDIWLLLAIGGLTGTVIDAGGAGWGIRIPAGQ